MYFRNFPKAAQNYKFSPDPFFFFFLIFWIGYLLFAIVLFCIPHQLGCHSVSDMGLIKNKKKNLRLEIQLDSLAKQVLMGQGSVSKEEA